MSDAAPNEPNPDEPPLVTRPDEAGAPALAPSRTRPGFWEAVAWCLVFVMAQMFGAILAVCVVFAAHTFAADNPEQFAKDQLDGFVKAVDAKATDPRPPVPAAFAEALAYGMLAAQLAALALIAVVVPRRVGPDWKRQLGVRRPHLLHVALVVLIVPGFMLSADAIQTIFVHFTGVKPPAAARALNSVFGKFPWPLTLLAVSIGPGVVEELWCRGFIGRGLCARYRVVWGALLTSVLFAAMHVDPSQLLVFTLMGAYLHFVYIATRSIWMPVLLHLLNNGVAIVLVLVLPPDRAERPTPDVVLLAALALMVFGTVALWTSRAALEAVTAKDEAWWEDSGWKPEYPGVSAPPPEVNVRLAHEVVSPAALMFSFVSFGALVFLIYRYMV